MSDYSLYRCPVCDKHVPGFDKARHTQQVHAGKEPHHIDHRGAGGDDVPENIITTCRAHHVKIHNGHIPKVELRAILITRYGYQYK